MSPAERRRCVNLRLRHEDCAGFEFIECATLKRLQGEWTAVKIVRDGQELPAMMLATGLRTATQNEAKITFGGQLMIHALVRIDESTDPIHVDYFNLCGSAKGTVQQGILQLDRRRRVLQHGRAGKPRPAEFECTAGSGRTLSQWRPKRPIAKR